jgi:uncharacterized integral membrane protein
MTTEPRPAQDPGVQPPPAAPQSAPAGPQSAPAGPQSAPGAQPSAGPAGTQPAAPPPSQQALPHHKIRRTRISGLWISVAFFAVVLLLLLIFILQNGTKVDVSYMGAHGHLPLGVALLFAAVCGVLLVVLAGAARISQLRATARRHRRADAKRMAAAQAAPPAS